MRWIVPFTAVFLKGELNLHKGRSLRPRSSANNLSFSILLIINNLSYRINYIIIELMKHQSEMIELEESKVATAAFASPKEQNV